MRKFDFSKKALYFVAVAAASFIGTRSYAVIPVNNAGALLNNVVVVTGANVTRATNWVTNRVATNFGINTFASNDQTNRLPNTIVTNIISLTNLGNIGSTFVLKLRATGSNGVGGGGTWATSIGSPVGIVARGGVTTATLRVTIPAGAANGHEKGYLLMLSNTTVAATAINSNYTGDDGFLYGGMLKDNGASINSVWITNAKNSPLTNGSAALITAGPRSNYVWSIRVRAPVVSIRKTAVVTNLTTVGLLNRPVPGATITYKIFASNSGGGTATGVTIYDLVSTNLVAQVAGAMKTNSTSTAFSATYASTPGGVATDAASDDRAFFGGVGAGYPANRFVVEFTPNANSANSTQNDGTGTIGANGGQFAGWFRVRIR